MVNEKRHIEINNSKFIRLASPAPMTSPKMLSSLINDNNPPEGK
jgi:hypothetical protein